MEFAAGDAAARGVSFPMSSSYRKEWRVVSEQSLRNTANEELESLKLGKCDERLIYEQQIEPADMNLCSIPVDRRLDSDILHQRFHAITKKREELQHMEIVLRAQINAGSEVMQVQNNFDAQIKKHANANVKLQNRIAQETILLKDEQLREAQSWMTRAQEMDTLQSTANRTLQAELQERTERCNQLWFGCQTQLINITSVFKRESDCSFNFD